jgi:acetyl esterase/lipase
MELFTMFRVKADYEGVPFMIAGESMGGLMSVVTGLKLQDDKVPDFEGLMLIAPALASKVRPPDFVVAILR